MSVSGEVSTNGLLQNGYVTHDTHCAKHTQNNNYVEKMTAKPFLATYEYSWEAARANECVCMCEKEGTLVLFIKSAMISYTRGWECLCLGVCVRDACACARLQPLGAARDQLWNSGPVKRQVQLRVCFALVRPDHMDVWVQWTSNIKMIAGFFFLWISDYFCRKATGSGQTQTITESFLYKCYIPNFSYGGFSFFFFTLISFHSNLL